MRVHPGAPSIRWMMQGIRNISQKVAGLRFARPGTGGRLSPLRGISAPGHPVVRYAEQGKV